LFTGKVLGSTVPASPAAAVPPSPATVVPVSTACGLSITVALPPKYQYPAPTAHPRPLKADEAPVEGKFGQVRVILPRHRDHFGRNRRLRLK
jgi:hypothetical protein